MLSYIIRRALVAVPTMLVLIVLSFMLMHAAPGSPFQSERGIPPEVMKNVMARYGLDQPLWYQIWDYTRRIVTDFDFGPSFKQRGLSVNDIIANGFPITLTYGGIAFVIASLLGVALGVISALRQNTWLDYITVGATFTAQAIPNFVIAPILVLIFTLKLGWLPGGGWNNGAWQNIVLPVTALAFSYIASVARIMRGSMLEVMNSNFIRTARAKGLPGSAIVWRHAMKPAMMPVISYLGPAFVGMITGSVIIDVYFSTGGIGVDFVDSALSRDYSVMMGITILYGALTILLNLIVDVAYAWLDPKIRY